MPRLTHQSWWCYRGHKNPGHTRECSDCSVPRYERHAQVHASERAVVFVNPLTGEHRTPARADMPMPEVYAKQGFERQEIMNMSEWEKRSGSVHEATNFTPGNEPCPERYGTTQPTKEVKDTLVRDMADAIASGPFTMPETLV